MKRKLMNNLLILLMLAVALCQNKAYAAENVMVSVKNDEFVSVVLPVIEESNSFNFFIDPLHVFYNTFGNSEGDVVVEKDTYLLFYNREESEYTLSSRSNSLKIINKSTVPVEVTIKAKLESTDGISIMQNEMFGDRTSCDLYLALVDNEGNKQPLSENGEVSVTVNLDRAPLDAYAYMLCEDTGEYEYVCQVEDVDFDTYFFGLTGACNEKGDWTSIKGKTHVIISWNVEPVFSDDSEAMDEEETLLDEEVPVDEDKILLDEDKTLMDEDKDSGKNTDIGTEDLVSEDNVVNNEKTSKESNSDIDHSSEEFENDSSTSEFTATEDIKDESAAFEEEKTQELSKPDEKEEDTEHNNASKEEKSDNDSSISESAADEDVKGEFSADEAVKNESAIEKIKDESATFEEEQTQELNKPDKKEEDTDGSGASKEDETNNDSSTNESATDKDVKDESAVFDDKQTQELNRPDEKTEDAKTFTVTMDKKNA